MHHFCLRAVVPVRGRSSHLHHAVVAQWQSRAEPTHRHEFDSRRPLQCAWEANLVKAPRRSRGEVGSKPTPGTTIPIRGVRPFSPPLRIPNRSRRVWPHWANPIGARAGSAYLPCKEIELGSSPRCSTNFIPDRPTVGRPTVNRSIQVRVLVGEPIRRGRLTGQDTRFSTGQPEFKSPSRHHQRTRSSTG